MGGECRQQVEADLIRSSSDYRHVVVAKTAPPPSACLHLLDPQLIFSGCGAALFHESSGIASLACMQDWRPCLQLHGCKPEYTFVDPKRTSTEQS